MARRLRRTEVRCHDGRTPYRNVLFKSAWGFSWWKRMDKCYEYCRCHNRRESRKPSTRLANITLTMGTWSNCSCSVCSSAAGISSLQRNMWIWQFPVIWHLEAEHGFRISPVFLLEYGSGLGMSAFCFHKITTRRELQTVCRVAPSYYSIHVCYGPLPLCQMAIGPCIRPPRTANRFHGHSQCIPWWELCHAEVIKEIFCYGTWSNSWTTEC